MRLSACDNVVVIGAGPAGLTAAYQLAKLGVPAHVVEQGNIVGGLARTETYKGYHFDMGGHRFYTKSDAVMAMWNEVLGDDFLRRPRLSRIYYKRRFFPYPLKPLATVRGLGLVESLCIAGSYLRWQLWPHAREDSFEQWVTNRFGRRLFEAFFRSYTEKVWGISCKELNAAWAAQRIKGLSLKSAVANMFAKSAGNIRTLTEQFYYPRQGPGMMWSAVRDAIVARGGRVATRTSVERIIRTNGRIEGIETRGAQGGAFHPGAAFLSSMPITDFLKRLSPAPPSTILESARKLRYRDFITVGLIALRKHLFPDNWIYIHEPAVKVGRIQNYKNWSPEMVPDAETTSLGMEYFCNEGDELWRLSNQALVALATKELEQIGLARAGDVVDGCVFRVPKSYPVYDEQYADFVERIKDYMAGFENCQSIGRNGLHRYNNQDHSMLTAMLAVRNLIYGESHDVWSVNADQNYQEEVDSSRDKHRQAAWERCQLVDQPVAAARPCAGAPQ